MLDATLNSSRFGRYWWTPALPSVIGFVALLLGQTAPAATITVTGTGDTIALDTFASLREVITSINNQADVNADVTNHRSGFYASLAGGTPDVINFNIAGSGVKTISVTGTQLPTIVRPLTINGYSQSGAAVNTLANSDNATILIELDGTGAGSGANGLTLAAGSGGSTGGAAATASPVTRPDVIVGSTNFYEQTTLGELYSQILEANGYKVTRRFNLGNREIVEPALESGQIDLDAEYLATLLAFLDKRTPEFHGR